MTPCNRGKGPNTCHKKLLIQFPDSAREKLITCLQKKVVKYIKDLQRRSIPVSRVAILTEVINIKPKFEDGKVSEVFFLKTDNSVYYGFELNNSL